MRFTSAMACGTDPISTSRSIEIGTLANLRIDSSGPSMASGGTTALTRLPSASRASTSGELSSTRRPTADEVQDVADALKTPGERTQVLGEVIWAMVASAEFRFNH